MRLLLFKWRIDRFSSDESAAFSSKPLTNQWNVAGGNACTEQLIKVSLFELSCNCVGGSGLIRMGAWGRGGRCSDERRLTLVLFIVAGSINVASDRMRQSVVVVVAVLVPVAAGALASLCCCSKSVGALFERAGGKRSIKLLPLRAKK